MSRGQSQTFRSRWYYSPMLREIQYVKQERKKDKRRWFTDDYWDLYVWVRTDGSFSGFQLCYGKTDQQRALTWLDGSAPVHTGVSEGSGYAADMSAPILVADGALDVEGVEQKFRADSAGIDPAVRRYVISQLEALPEQL